MMLFGLQVRSVRIPVPLPIVFYAVLGILDFGFTLMALQLGFKEGNPILDWYADKGLFEFVKVGTTTSVVLIGFLLWELRIVRAIVILANVLMVGVVGFHMANLISLIIS